MNRHILFIQGGGEGGYEADQALVASLQTVLGKQYKINYPAITTDEAAADFGWMQQIGSCIGDTQDGIILVAHSFGASMLMKYLSENTVGKKIAAVFLVAAPFWDGKEDWQAGLKLSKDFAEKLPEVPMFFYHCKDDEEIPVSHVHQYKSKIANATFREIENGGHQFNNDLTVVANDIRSL